MISINLFNKTIEAAVETHQGNVRLNNEDNYSLCGKFKSDMALCEASESVKTRSYPLVFAVCDGMGGEEYGEVASLLAAQSIKALPFNSLPEKVSSDLLDVSVLIDKKREELNAKNMGSTFAALYIGSGYAVACNIGDSRVYHLGMNGFEQLSTDHRANGNQLTQYLGVAPDDFIIEPYFHEAIRLRSGDRYLICSDGISDMLDDEILCALMKKDKNAPGLVHSLVSEALSAGGKDNATALVVKVL